VQRPHGMLRAVRTDAWGSATIVGFDIETTGLDVEVDEPVSYAFVEFKAGVLAGVEEGWVLPRRPISAGAASVHGLTPARLGALGAVDLDTGIRRIAARLGALCAANVPVVGCNLTYDLTIVDRVLARSDRGGSLRDAGWTGPALDVLVLDRGLDPDFEARPARRLDALCEHYGRAAPSHTARSDAEAAVLVLLSQLARFEQLTAWSLRELQARQAAWHAQWCVDWCTRKRGGQGSLFGDEEPWPYDDAGAPPRLALAAR
jgi:DNA polymerase-3 subunit epsilon